MQTSSLEASRAKILALLNKVMEEQKELREMNLGCGMKCISYVGKIDINTSSLKIAQLSLFEDLSMSYVTLPKSGMMLSGNVYEATISASRIKEKEFTLLPTPSKCDALVMVKSKRALENYIQKGHQDKLLYQCQLNGLNGEMTSQIYEWIQSFPKDWTKEE